MRRLRALWMRLTGLLGRTVFQEIGYIVAPAVYRPLAQSAPRSLALTVAAQGSPLSLTSDIQRALSRAGRRRDNAGQACP